MDDPLLGDTSCTFREKEGIDQTDNVTNRRDKECNILRMVVRNPCSVVLHCDAAQSENGSEQNPRPNHHDSGDEQVYDKCFVVILFIPWDRDSLRLRDDNFLVGHGGSGKLQETPERGKGNAVGPGIMI